MKQYFVDELEEAPFSGVMAVSGVMVTVVTLYVLR